MMCTIFLQAHWHTFMLRRASSSRNLIVGVLSIVCVLCAKKCAAVWQLSPPVCCAASVTGLMLGSIDKLSEQSTIIAYTAFFQKMGFINN